MTEHRAINLSAKLSEFADTWAPRTVSTFNGHDVMVVKVDGEFDWHHHDDTDDFFLVISGRLTIELEDGAVELVPGEFYVVPRGVEHRPVAHGLTELLLMERTGTPNTGDHETAAPRTVI